MIAKSSRQPAGHSSAEAPVAQEFEVAVRLELQQ